MKILKHIIILFFFTSSALANGFTDSHDSTKSYAHPSFVLYNDEPYRTLKAVPVNTLITNTEYWVSLKTEASQQTLPQGETPPETDTSQLTNSVPTNGTPLVAPSFSVGSTDAVNYQENGSSSVYTADATGALSYSISSGDDIGLFEINSATGVLTFKSSPDYESPTDQGSNNNYSVTITATNSAGTAELSLSVVVTDDTSDNLTSISSVFGISCRAYIDDAPMVGGLTIRGTDSKLVLIRAKGPSMQSVLPGKKMLPNPKIKIQKLDEETGVYSTVLQTNDYGDHESASEYSSEATGNNLEPMIVTSLDPGVYSIKVQDQTSGETGNANLEIYALNDDSGSSLFFGLSGRAYISDAPMVGGLTIKGTESMNIMIRAKGPSMQSVLPGKKMLPDPKVKVQKLNEVTGAYSTVLQTNDYGDHESASEYSSEATGNNTEPMVVTSLEPGIYSIKVQDQTSGETGNTNLEIYSFD